MTETFDGFAEDYKSAWSRGAHDTFRRTQKDLSEEIQERQALGAQLAAARVKRALSQQMLAERSGLQQAEISRIERGLGNPTTSTLMRLLDALEYELTLTPLRSSSGSASGK